MKLIKASELNNEQYHSEKGHYSSSQLKVALADIELFHKQYILGESKLLDSPALAIGNYFHTAILEPELLDKECAVFMGKMRRGTEWTAFKKKHEGKSIITASDYEKATNLIEAIRSNEVATWILSKGEAETSAMGSLMGVSLKIRTDWVCVERGFIGDLKSTTGNAKDTHKIQNTINNYSYDLSSALYIDVFNAVAGKEVIKDFYLMFASKDVGNSQMYKMSQEMLSIGRAKYRCAIKKILKAKKEGWVFADTVESIDPAPWERDMWIKKEESKDSDLL